MLSDWGIYCIIDDNKVNRGWENGQEIIFLGFGLGRAREFGSWDESKSFN